MAPAPLARSASARPLPADQTVVRRHNLTLVLRLLYDRGPRSRAGIAVETGLNKATVSSLVSELEERGLVRELGFADERRTGRPATLVEVDGRRVVSIGLELNVDFISVLATDLAGRELFRRRRPLDAPNTPRTKVIKALALLLEQALAEVEAPRTTVAGITVAVPGIVEVGSGTLRLAPNLHWADVPLVELLREAIGRPVPMSIDNEANLAALAEYRGGQYAGTENLIYVIGEVGIGGGIVVGGQMLRGMMGYTGEIGHMCVDRGGHKCACGAVGCWETIIGLLPLLRDAVPDLADQLEADSSLGPEAKMARVVERAQAGDQRALDALHRNGEWLGIGLGNLVNLFNPEVIVLAGFFLDIAPWVLPVAEDTLRRHTISPNAGGVRLALSTLGFSAAALGGAMYAAERVFSDPGCVPTLSA